MTERRHEANRAVVEALFSDVLNGGRLERLEGLVARNYVDYSPAAGQAAGVAGVRDKIVALRTAFADICFSLEELLAERDLVAARWYFTGTQSGPLGPLPASGRHVRVNGIDFYRIVRGRIAEHWACEDELGMLRQLGVVG